MQALAHFWLKSKVTLFDLKVDFSNPFLVASLRVKVDWTVLKKCEFLLFSFQNIIT